MPIDLFFMSLAEVHKSYAIGVVLSGTGFDGSLGLKHIKEHDGITYAQDPETAGFDAMPLNAIKTDSTDFVLPPEDIAAHLLFIKKAYHNAHAYNDDSALKSDDEGIIKNILRIVQLRSGNDFSNYKQPTIRRRIARRMVITKQFKASDYLVYLRENHDEQDALFNDILIPVTYFFRDSNSFNALTDAVFPLLLKNKANSDGLRIWSAGCSTGEEAYSLAICLHEFLERKAPGVRVQIFASDISAKVIVKARRATYTLQELQHVSEERIEKYFTKSNGNYQLKKEIRDMCVFAVHNFVKDPPFSKMNMIVCRNALIYLTPTLQKKALKTFHYSLKENGILFLGKSEATTSVPNLFTPLLRNHKFFTRKSVAGEFTPTIDNHHSHSEEQRKNFTTIKGNAAPDFQKVAFNLLLSKYTPAAVIINEQKEIVHFHGDTSSFLLMPSGKPNFNILKMAKAEISFEIRSLLVKIEESAVTSVESQPLKIKDCNYLVELELSYLEGLSDKNYLLVFKRIETVEVAVPKNHSESTIQEIHRLEAEIQHMRDDMRRVSEDYETSNEELQSVNEELLSNSEELQSLNEELETTSEELQSNNEELISVNDELMERHDELIRMRNYAEAIVETIREPLIILDKNLRIKSANKSFFNYFKVTEEDVYGKLLHNLGIEDYGNSTLFTDLMEILREQSRLSDYEADLQIKGIGKRSFVLNARQILNDRKDEQLILLALDDITAIKVSREQSVIEENLRTLANSSPVLLWITDENQKATFFNDGWLQFTGRTYKQEIGHGWQDSVHPDDLQRVATEFTKAYRNRLVYYIEYRLKQADGFYKWIAVKGIPRYTIDNEFIGYVGGCMDIDSQKRFAVNLKEQVMQRTQDLRESQAFLKSVLDTTPNLIYIYDLEKNKIIFINGKSEEATGYTVDEMINSDEDLFTPLIHDDDLKDVLKSRKKLKKLGSNEVLTVEFRLKNNDGWTCQLSRDMIFKRNESGTPIQYIGVCTDVSEIKNSHALLHSKNSELERSNVELASFSSIASHDLKEPLRKIMIFNKLILSKDYDSLSAESQGYIDRVIVSANRMQQLIDDLISYSRISGRSSIKFEKVDLNCLVDESLDDLNEEIEAKNVTIEVSDLPEIRVISSQFRQLFNNLIGNAIKYKREDVDPIIRIWTEIPSSKELTKLTVAPNLKYIKILVSDNGIGFEKKYQDKIFEPFQRLHNKDEYSGAGIGLSICRKIMANHNGLIMSESEPGEGATFKIYLPISL